MVMSLFCATIVVAQCYILCNLNISRGGEIFVDFAVLGVISENFTLEIFHGVVTSIPPIDALATGRFNQAIKGYFCIESSDQDVRKSGDQAPLES